MIRILKPALFFLAFLVAACGAPKEDAATSDAAPEAIAPEADAPSEEAPATEAPAYDWTTTESGLSYMDVVVGDGDEIASGQTATMHYTGWLWDETKPEGKGEKFDSSRDRNEPFPTQIGVGRVIQGWDEGVPGMKIGGRRMLRIPYQLGYGEAGRGPIPAMATMLFDVELLAIQ